MKYYLGTILALMLFGVPAISSRFGDDVGRIAQIFSSATDQVAAVVLSHRPKTVESIKSNYASPIVAVAPVNGAYVPRKVRVLIVPGHEPAYGGAEYRDIKERDMAVDMAYSLKKFLDADGHYQTFITRDAKEWSPDLSSYFRTNWNDIVAWQKASVKDMARRISSGSTTKPVSLVYHNTVPSDVAFRLYGINKWVNDNDIDITIHIHFNDDPERVGNKPGSYTGFAIYIPERQYANSTTSKVIARSVFDRLAKHNSVSNLKGETRGIVEEPELIAVGAHDTVDAASMLIEYGYIYENRFSTAEKRARTFEGLAHDTFLGLDDFFSSKDQ